jgi:uncharacterized protein with LGFP repeats
VSTLDDLNAGPGGIAGWIGTLSQRLRPVPRRSLLVGAAVAGSALATRPRDYVLRPVAAYATICGPGNTASSGWTVFCATINKGVNTCPPGSFAAGWWKAADSSWCGGGYRYIVDCNASCSKCTTGCSDGICDSKCWSCSCGTGSTATCDQRRICCNAFRYGQCNTQVKCSGGVHCRVVSCVAPYKWASCTTTSLQDDRTAEHSSPSLPRWGVIEQKYRDLGAQASFLKASTGPIRSVGDGKGSYVSYQGGVIVTSAATGTWAVYSWINSRWQATGGARGPLGYPTSDQVTGRPDGGWIQLFETGAVVDSASTSTQVVHGPSFRKWTAAGRESGVMGYPTSGLVTGLRDGGWIQTFQHGAVVDSASTSAQAVNEERWPIWVAAGRENGVLGYPVFGATFGHKDGGWIQRFQRGCVTRSAGTPALVVAGVMDAAWSAAGRYDGVLGYPTESAVKLSRGSHQTFQGGELWALGTGPARRVQGAVLSQWRSAGGADGSYGWPVADTAPTGDGRLTCRFEGGTITA